MIEAIDKYLLSICLYCLECFEDKEHRDKHMRLLCEPRATLLCYAYGEPLSPSPVFKTAYSEENRKKDRLDHLVGQIKKIFKRLTGDDSEIHGYAADSTAGPDDGDYTGNRESRKLNLFKELIYSETEMDFETTFPTAPSTSASVKSSNRSNQAFTEPARSSSSNSSRASTAPAHFSNSSTGRRSSKASTESATMTDSNCGRASSSDYSKRKQLNKKRAVEAAVEAVQAVKAVQVVQAVRKKVSKMKATVRHGNQVNSSVATNPRAKRLNVVKKGETSKATKALKVTTKSTVTTKSEKKLQSHSDRRSQRPGTKKCQKTNKPTKANKRQAFNMLSREAVEEHKQNGRRSLKNDHNDDDNGDDDGDDDDDDDDDDEENEKLQNAFQPFNWPRT